MNVLRQKNTLIPEKINLYSMKTLQVSEACEKQLATQHKLAPGLRKDVDTTTEGRTVLIHS